MKESRSITIKDVAREAGVAVGTVSNVLNGIPVGSDYRHRVEEAVKKLGYHVNRQARALRCSQNSLVGVILPDLYDPFYSILADCLCRELAHHSLQVMLCLTGGDPGLEQAYLLMSGQWAASGIICLSEHSDLRVPDGIPAVSIDRPLGPGIPCITSDNYIGGCIAAQKLIDNGCKSLAFLCAGSPVSNETDKRRDGFVRVCTDAGVSFDSMCVRESASDSVLEDFLRLHLHGGRLEYDGLFCATDHLVHQVRHILAQMDLNVPKDVQIIGYGGMKGFGDRELSCSTIVQPVEEMAQMCVDLILRASQRGISCSLQLPVYYAFGGTTDS